MSFKSATLVSALALATLAGAHIAGAAEIGLGTLELDPAKTVIEFRLPGTLHTTHGTFNLKRGIIDARPAGKADGMLDIDAASGDSGLSARDNRMKDIVLETQKYPEIIFVPRHVDGLMQPNGDFQAALQGVITLHGSRHEMTINAQGHVEGRQLIATCHFSIPYVDWGMKDPSLLMLSVAKHVEIDVATAGRIKDRRN
jgi:polyisoprenoid-binding protein YceI